MVFQKLIDNNEDNEIFKTDIINIFDYGSTEQEFKSNLTYFFCEYFFKCIVGSKTWKKEITNKKLSQIMSVSDEALAYLIYENNKIVWMRMIETKNTKKTDVKTKYTAERGGNVLNNGWSREGLLRFNTYVKWVKDERKLQKRKEYECKFLLYKQNTITNMELEKKRTIDNLEAITPYADPSSDEESDGESTNDSEEEEQKENDDELEEDDNDSEEEQEREDNELPEEENEEEAEEEEDKGEKDESEDGIGRRPTENKDPQRDERAQRESSGSNSVKSKARTESKKKKVAGQRTKRKRGNRS